MKHLSYLFLLVLLFGSGCGSTKKLQQLLLDGSRTPAAFSETISYEEVGGLIVVEAKLGGATRRFLFDTGAPNLISKELAREIGAVVHTRQRVRDSQGKAE
ncbi:MAG: aspartyl protease family protein, partial [Saprospiraceae bacterium]|nr:aspartyl protease family protein [Saprospiraceae bacterium]